MTGKSQDIELAEFLSQFRDDPLGFVMAAYPWDTDPGLQVVRLVEPWASRYPNCAYGPDSWACELLDAIGSQVRENGFTGEGAVPAVRVAVSSGHGVGKSAMTAWLVDWIMSTRPHCQGTVTANTAAQLSSKTWARIASWTKKLINASWFNVATGRGNMFLRCKFSPDDWFFSGQTCRKEEAEAFAGQHAADSSSVYIFDEASAIPREIWEVAEGGLTDGEPFLFAFGNPTRNSGAFYDAFHRDRGRFIGRRVDSRSCQITNKQTIEEWRKTYGEDSDFFKVRVRGDFPNQSSTQLIPTGVVDAAMAREQPAYDSRRDTVAVVGVDVGRFGDDDSTVFVRVGNAVPIVEVHHGLDGWELGAQVARVIDSLRGQGFETVYTNVDAGGVGASPIDYLRHNGYSNGLLPVNFGGRPDDQAKYANKRSEMWGLMREWLQDGGCLKFDDQLKEDLTAPEYFYDSNMRILLEKKEDVKARIGRSPDRADGLALTFARRVAVTTSEGFRRARSLDMRTRNVARYQHPDALDVSRALRRW